MDCEGSNFISRKLVQARYQKLRPRPNGPSREQVAAHQRERLWRAIVESVAQDGYGATTVGRLCMLAGVSKRAFYELFSDKLDCFAFAYERVVLGALRHATEPHSPRGLKSRGPRGLKSGGDVLGASEDGALKESGCDQLRAMLRALMDGVVREPAAGRFALVHSPGAPSAAIDRREWAAGVFEAAIVDCLPDGAPSPSPAVRRGIVSGIAAVVRARLFEERVDELPAVADELAQWAWCCVRGAAAMARGGVPALTPGGLVADSGVPRRRVYASFESPDQCLIEALDDAGEELLARARRAGAAGDGWQDGVRRAVVALLGGLAGDQALTRALFVESLAVEPGGVELRASLCARAARMLSQQSSSAARGSLTRDALIACSPTQAANVGSARRSLVACEASVGAVWGVVERHVALGGAARLPRLAMPAYLLLLAPSLVAAESSPTVEPSLDAASLDGQGMGAEGVAQFSAPLALVGGS